MHTAPINACTPLCVHLPPAAWAPPDTHTRHASIVLLRPPRASPAAWAPPARQPPAEPPGGETAAEGGAGEGKGPGSALAPPPTHAPPPPPRGAPTNRGRRRPGSSRKARESFFTHTFSSFAPGAAAIKKKTNHSAHGKPAAGPGLLLLPAAGPAARTCGDVLRLGRPIAHGSILRRSLLGKDRCQQLKNTPRRGESRRQ